MRPNATGDTPAGDDRLYQSALTMLRRRTGVDMAFGGRVTDGQLRLSEFHGALTNSLAGLRVSPGLGLGGAVLASGRPGRVSDYENATSITHDFDDPVLTEGLGGVLASPVVVRGNVRGVLYVGVRTDSVLAGRTGDALTRVAGEVAGELRIGDEVERRVTALAGADGGQARELSAEVREIAGEISDARERERLLRACARVDGIAAAPSVTAPEALSARERDVLGGVAEELTNAEIADRLSLRPETVKAYLRAAMRKLDVHSRHQAVSDARRHGMLP